MYRAIFLAGLAALLVACAPQKSKDLAPETPWTGDSGLAPPSLQQPDAATARESDVSPIQPTAAAAVPPPLPSETAPVKAEQLGGMSDSSPGAANVIQRPCDLENCGVVLAIGVHQAAESVAQDDGGPGVYMPQGLYSAETAGQPGVWDGYGVQKVVQLWDISVQMRNGGIQVIQQSHEPLFRVGDPVLVNGDQILPWN